MFREWALSGSAHSCENMKVERLEAETPESQFGTVSRHLDHDVYLSLDILLICYGPLRSRRRKVRERSKLAEISSFGLTVGRSSICPDDL